MSIGTVHLSTFSFQSRRGEQQEVMYIDESRVMLKYMLPLSEVIVDFYDELKSQSSGYARFVELSNLLLLIFFRIASVYERVKFCLLCSFDYEDEGYRETNIVRVRFRVHLFLTPLIFFFYFYPVLFSF